MVRDDDRASVEGMVADYFGNTPDEDTQTFTGFDADSRDEVLIPDLQDRQDASDAFGDDTAADAEAAAPEEASTASGDSRRSKSESHPPERYHTSMGGDPLCFKITKTYHATAMWG